MKIFTIVAALTLTSLFLSFGEPPSERAIAGVGARPLTDTLAATWFTESVAPPSDYRMAVVFFLLGEPGWTKKKMDWAWGTADPAHSSFVGDNWSLKFEYSKDTGRWTAGDSSGLISEANVIVLSGCGSADSEIVHKERLDLDVPFEGDPMLAVVKQSETLRTTLGLE